MASLKTSLCMRSPEIESIRIRTLADKNQLGRRLDSASSSPL